MPGNKKVFAVFGGKAPAEVDKRISTIFPEGARRQVGSGNWLVADPAQSSSVLYEKIKSGGDLDCIVVTVMQYYGWKDKAVWEWIETAQK